MPPLKSQELKTATANHEESQAALVALEDPEEGASITADGAVETARAQAQKTAKLVEECKAQRAERNSAFGRAKEAASQQRLVALRDVVKEFGPADATALPIVPPTPAGRYEPLQEM